MKKTLNLSIAYFIAAIIGGVFYREFTKFMAYTQTTTLAFVHVHLFVLGMLLFLVLTLFCIHTDLQNHKKFQLFLILYNIGLPLTVIMLIVRGITQVLALSLSKGADAAISGIAGIGHIIITIALIMLFIALKNVLPDNKN